MTPHVPPAPLPPLPATPTPEGALAWRFDVAVCPDAELRDRAAEILAALGGTAWLDLAGVDDPEPCSLAEDALLLATVAGAPSPLGDLPEAAPEAPRRSGFEVAPDGRLVPALALELHRANDPQSALAHLRSPARLLAHHPDMLVHKGLPPAVVTAVKGWLDAARAPLSRADALDRAERAPSPVLRAEGLRALMADADPVQDPHGVQVDRVGLLERRVAAELDFAASPADDGARLDHALRRHIRHVYTPRSWDDAAAHLLDALFDSPFVGVDPFLLGERLRVAADRAGVPSDAPPGFDLTRRWDTPRAISLVARLPSRPREIVSGVLDLLGHPDSAEREEVLLAAADALGDRATWIGRLPSATRAALIRALAQLDPPAGEASDTRPRPAIRAIFAERSALTAPDREELAVLWRTWRGISSTDAHLALLGLTALPVLEPPEQVSLLDACVDATPDWRLGLVHTFIEESADPASRRSAADRVLTLLSQPEARSLHAPAAALLLQLTRKGQLPPAYSDRTIEKLTPALRHHPRVAEELRRAGRA